MNATFYVLSILACEDLPRFEDKINTFDPIWRQTTSGCRILQLLRDMYGFNVSYIFEDVNKNLTMIGGEENFSAIRNQSIDIYLRPMSFGLENIKYTFPVLAAYNWRFGFVLRRPAGHDFYKTFYSKPFTRPTWNCLYAMALCVSILFYFLKKWEYSVVGGWDCSFPYEVLMVIGSYCQHIPPIEATLPSRRIAYFIFFIFAYVIYTYYTSNLLSNLVNEKEHSITLATLADSNLELAIVDNMMLSVSENAAIHSFNYSIIIEKLRSLRSVSIEEGFKGVDAGKMALLSDYTSLYPYIKNQITLEYICELSRVDLFSNVKKYFFTSRQFPFKEQFRIGTLRAKESGILKRLLGLEYQLPTCASNLLVQTRLVQISTPISALLFLYGFSVIILIMERLHYKRNKVWPYVE